jgi:hypothetical protein
MDFQPWKAWRAYGHRKVNVVYRQGLASPINGKSLQAEQPIQSSGHSRMAPECGSVKVATNKTDWQSGWRVRREAVSIQYFL